MGGRFENRRIVFLQPFDWFAGSQRVAVSVVAALRGLGGRLHIRLGFGTNGFVAQIPGVCRFSGVDSTFVRKILYPIWIVLMIPQMLWSVYKKDMIWANTAYAIPVVLPVLLLAPRNVILHMHEIEFPRAFKYLLLWAASRGAHVLCVSKLQRQRLGVPAWILPNCVEHYGDSELRAPPILLYVGAMTPQKGFPLFVEVARRLPRDRVQAVACIPFESKGAKVGAADALEAGIILRFGISDPIEIFDGATLMLQCTDASLATETFSLVSAEALASGVPVATAGMAVAGEILGDAWAFDVPSRDPERIASEVLALLDDAPRHQALRRAALARRLLFSFSTFQDRVIRIVTAVNEESVPNLESE